MHRYLSGALGVFLSAFLAASPALAAEDQPTHNDLVEMNTTLKEIVRALKQQAETQKADLLLKRVTLATTQLANAQERLSRIDRELAALENERGEVEAVMAAAQREQTPPADPVAAQARTAEIKRHWQSVQDRLNGLRQERVVAENDLGALRREARDWETLLDKMLTSGS